jgi:hypothetical protein
MKLLWMSTRSPDTECKRNKDQKIAAEGMMEIIQSNMMKKVDTLLYLRWLTPK